MSASDWRHVVFSAAIFVCGSAAPLMAQVLEPEALQRKQEDQQRARTMTRDLLGGVLDIQLRQLDENGLADQEIYRDILLMRQNLNHLVETEMSKVVDLLAEAQKLPPEKREAAFVEARQQIRAVVRQLSVERQNLLKRLKIAELAEQVRRLIRHQVVVQTATRGLITETQTRQEALTLKAIEDQRDVKELFLHLVDTMVDMKSWSGILAVAAADGLRILKAAEVGKHFDGASRQLQGLKYVAATDEQELVIKGLKELLKVIERTQGALNSENMKSIDRVRALMDRQKQLREETKSLTDNQQPTAEMVERQAALQKEIANLTDTVRENPKAESYIQQAETAALDAAANLLDNKLEQAQSDQGRVLGNLAALEMALKDQAKQQTRDKSANELANTVKELQQAKAALAEAQKKQDSAEAKALENAPAAAADTKQVAAIAEQTMDQLSLPTAVENALAETILAAREATKNLESANAGKATAVEEKALQKASDALDRAVASVDAALADAQRQESAVKIGELARAAEVLERAAAEERAIAKEATALAQGEQSDPAAAAAIAKDLRERQQDVKLIAEKGAEALAQTSPAAAKNATEGAAKATQSSDNLQGVAEQKATDLNASATQAAQSATDAAQKLAEAAKEIRNEIVATAKELSKRTAAQAEQLAEARAAVEKAVDDLPSQDKVAKLEAAKSQLGQAMQEQAKAQGRPEAAAAMDLASQIANALDAQDAAAAAADAVEAGVGSELKATTKQEEVAEKSQALADTAAKRPQAQAAKAQAKPDPLAQALNEAQQAAALAAKQTLDGNADAAEVSRNVAEAALKQAMELAQAEAATAAAAPPTAALNLPAQTAAAAAAKESQATAAKASSDTAGEVAPAAAATATAAETLAANPEQAAAAQATAAEALNEAGKKLDEAIAKAAAEQSGKLATQADQTAALADQVASVAPAAAEAIDAAAQAARLGADLHQSPHQLAEAANTAELALEHAAADLGAKEQEVRRDQAIAESIANLAQGQQSAAEVISEQATQLENMSTQGDALTEAQQLVAQLLNDAQQDFASSQRATGQGAVELSGQNEVANLPLREALELASKLPALEQNAAMLAEGMLADGTLDKTNGLLATDGQPLADDGQPVADAAANPGDAQGNPPAAAPSKSGQPAAGKPTGLGTGFIPNSPQLTAEMMAGAKAQQAAQKALSQQLAKSQSGSNSQKPPQTPTNASEKGEPVDSEHADSTKLTKKEGSATTNQKVKDGAVEKMPEGTDAAAKSTSKGREKEEGITARQVKEEAWFAKLPPELRKSIRAGAGQKPPRAYEERLKNYFQSVD